MHRLLPKSINFFLLVLVLKTFAFYIWLFLHSQKNSNKKRKRAKDFMTLNVEEKLQQTITKISSKSWGCNFQIFRELVQKVFGIHFCDNVYFRLGNEQVFKHISRGKILEMNENLTYMESVESFIWANILLNKNWQKLKMHDCDIKNLYKLLLITRNFRIELENF